MSTEGKNELNEWKLTQKGCRHIFQQQIRPRALREAGDGRVSTAGVKEGGQWQVPGVTQRGNCPAPVFVGVAVGVNGRENRKRAPLCELQKALKPPRQISCSERGRDAQGLTAR